MTDPDLDALEDSDSSLFEPHPGSEDLAIFFSGRGAGFRDRFRFAFHRQAQAMPINRLFLRDNFGVWYHRGLEGLTTRIDDSIALIRDFTTARGFRNIYVIGVSSGTYGALVFAPGLGACRVVCLGAISTVAPEHRGLVNEKRIAALKQSLDELWGLPDPETAFYDAAVYLDGLGRKCPPIHVFYDPASRKDKLHANRLAKLRQVELVEWDGVEHDIGKMIDRLYTEPGLIQKMTSPPKTGFLDRVQKWLP